MSVQENQFARHDDKAFALVALERLETTEQQLGQLARIRRCGGVAELAVRVERDAGFRGVGDNETDFGLVGKRHECRVLRIGIQCAAVAASKIQYSLITSAAGIIVAIVLTPKLQKVVRRLFTKN